MTPTIPDFTLHTRNFGGFPSIRWSPGLGIHLLSGPPGSSPDAPIRAMEFLSEYYNPDPEFYRSIRSDDVDNPALIGIQAGEDTWWVRCRADGTAFEECVTTDPEQDPDDVGWKTYTEPFNTRAPEGLDRVLRSLAVCDTTRRLADEDGVPLVDYLFRWHLAIPCRQTWDAVKAALPSLPATTVDLLDRFMDGSLYPTPGCSPIMASCDLIRVAEIAFAVAQASPGTVLAIPGFDAGLHPFTIRRLFEFMQQISDRMYLTILLEGRSPATYTEFQDNPWGVLVMDPASAVNPVSVGDIFNPDWLSHFTLGDLYNNSSLDTHRKESP